MVGRLYYSYLVFDDGSAKPAFYFLIPLDPWCCSIVGIFSFLKAIILIIGYYFILISLTLRQIIMFILCIWWWLYKAGHTKLFSSRYPLTQNAVGLLESSPLLKGNYFNNWFLYNFIINYSPLDYYIPTMHLMMAMQSRHLTSWYPLPLDAVELLECSPLLEGN
jgi:hypothetical protein